MKKCSKCNELKSYDFFSKHKRHKDGYQSECKSCVAEYLKQWSKANEEQIKERTKKYYQENKKYLKEKVKQWCQENKEQLKEYQNQYRKENKDKIKEQTKQYYEENKEKINEYRKQWQQERKKTNPLFKMKVNLRSRTSKAFKNKGYSKNTKTQEMLGVEWEVAKEYIERQFTKGMSWSNYGEWQIDHIIPLSSANTEEELINLCRYTNLQPLWAEDNLSKGCKIEEIQLKIL